MTARILPLFARRLPTASTPAPGPFDAYTDAQLFATMELGGPEADGAASVLLARYGEAEFFRRRRAWLDGAA